MSSDAPAPRGRSGARGTVPRPSHTRATIIAHRRRRAGALALVAVAALVVGILVGAGGSGGSAQRVPARPGGYFSQVRSLAGTGTGSFAAAEQRAENTAINRTLAYTPYVRMAGTQHREIALTFDDGPGPYTLRVLSVLEREHTPATFFEVGIDEKYFSAGTMQIEAHGYPIGDHTENHLPMAQLSRAQQRQQLLTQSAAIGDEGAPFPRMFRPPYGVWNDTTLQLLSKYRMLMVLWSVDTDDWERPGTAAIVHAALSGAKPGAIILMHDAGGDRSETIAALPTIIRELRARGYKLVTVPRLLLDNPAPKQQDVASLRGQGG